MSAPVGGGQQIKVDVHEDPSERRNRPPGQLDPPPAPIEPAPNPAPPQNLDEIVPYPNPSSQRFVQPPNPARDNPGERKRKAHSVIRIRLRRMISDIVFADRNANAVTCLNMYGYIVSIFMTLWGWEYYKQFGRPAINWIKFGLQIIGLIISTMAAVESFKAPAKALAVFIVYQAVLTILILLAILTTFCGNSRAELYRVYTSEPYYNMKLIDQPFVEKFSTLDMSSEPAYELSLLYFRLFFMLGATLAFNLYTLWAAGRRYVKEKYRPASKAAGGGNADRDDIGLQELNVGQQRPQDEEIGPQPSPPQNENDRPPPFADEELGEQLRHRQAVDALQEAEQNERRNPMINWCRTVRQNAIEWIEWLRRGN